MTEQEAVKTEIEILGVYCAKKDLFEECGNLISEKLFSPVNQTIYRIIENLHKEGISPDIIMIRNKLTNIGYKITEATTIASNLTYKNRIEINIKHYVNELYNFRKTSEMYNLCSNIAMDQSITLEVGISNLKNFISETEYQVNNVNTEVAIDDVFERFLTKLKTEQTDDINITTGSVEIDKATGGIRAPYVYLWGARPGMGKTSFLIGIIRKNLPKKNVIKLVFSLEMPADDLILSLVSSEFQIDNQWLLTNEGKRKLTQFHWTQIQSFKKTLIESNVIIDDTPGITWQYVNAKIRKYRKIYPSQEIIVLLDFIQRMGCAAEDAKGKTPEGMLDYMCSKLADVAKEHRVAIVEFSQLGREVEKRPVPIPQLSDLKGSGGLETNAAYIFFIYRPEYYKIFKGKEGEDLTGLAKIIIAKNRYGPLKNVLMRFVGCFYRFDDIERIETDTNQLQINTGGDSPSF